MRVRVYRKLAGRGFRAGGPPVYSLLDPRTGLVVGHASAVLLSSAKFIVRKAGRERVLRERRKNVHAFVEGVLADVVQAPGGRACPPVDGTGAWGIGADSTKRLGPKLSYNPYKAEHFIREDLGIKVVGAGGVLLNADGMSGCYLHST